MILRQQQDRRVKAQAGHFFAHRLVNFFRRARPLYCLRRVAQGQQQPPAVRRFPQRPPQIARHLVEGARQLPDLIVRMNVDPVLQISRPDPFCAPCQLAQRARDRAGEEEAGRHDAQGHHRSQADQRVAQALDRSKRLRPVNLREDTHLSFRQPAVGAQDTFAPVISIEIVAALPREALLHARRVYRFLERIRLAEPGIGDEEIEVVDQITIFGLR